MSWIDKWTRPQIILVVTTALGTAFLTTVIYVLNVGATYGRLSAQVEHLSNQVSRLEIREMSGTTKVGDLCLKLMEAQNAAYGGGASYRSTSEAIDKQLEKLGCYDKVPVSVE